MIPQNVHPRKRCYANSETDDLSSPVSPFEDCMV